MLDIKIINQLRTNDSELTSLDLSWKQLDDADYKALFSALTTNTALRTLNLQGTRISGHNLILLATALSSNRGLKTLNLSHNPSLSYREIQPLCQALLENSTLENLDLSMMDLGVASLESLSDAIFNNFSLLKLEVTTAYNTLFDKFLERNNYRRANPKAPFNPGLMTTGAAVSEPKPDTFYSENKRNIVSVLSMIFLQALDGLIVSERVFLRYGPNLQLITSQLNQAQNLEIISNFFESYIYSFNNVAIEDLSTLLFGSAEEDDNPSDNLLRIAHFINYLLEFDHVEFLGSLGALFHKMIPEMNTMQRRITLSKFMQIAYELVISNHQEGLIRKWVPGFSASESPLPKSKKQLQTLLEESLRRASAYGDSASVELLATYVEDINAADAHGLRALDFANLYAIKNNDRIASDILKEHQAQLSNSEQTDREKEEAWAALLSEDEMPPLESASLDDSISDLKDKLIVVLCMPLITYIGRLHIQLFGLNTQNQKQFLDVGAGEIRDGVQKLAQAISDDHRAHLLGINQSAILPFVIQHYLAQMQTMVGEIFRNTFPTATPELIAGTLQYFMQSVGASEVNLGTNARRAEPPEQKKSPEDAQKELASQLKSEQDRMIRVWLSAYRSIAVEIPPIEAKRRTLLEQALVNATQKGAINDVNKLITWVSNINAQKNASQQTALHHAILYVNETGNWNCFKALREAGASLTIQDIKGNTPLDLWNHREHPNAELMGYLKSEKSEVCVLM